MSNTLSKFLFFAAGAAIGSVVTWKLINDKYEQLAQEEIKSIREYYQSKDSDDNFEETEDEEEPCEKEEEKEVKIDMDRPYVISPDEFDDPDVGYETVTLYYYQDGVLAYMLSNEKVEDIEELVGEESLEHFGEYEDDSVFVRNDYLGLDIEILRAEENYSEDE